MEEQKTSFWSEIKKFEDTLSKDPASFCFAPLAELYRRVGMLDDAIAVAENGTAQHPEYVGGYLVLGRAYSDKGMTSQAREVLERVVRFTPENLLAQKCLSNIYIDSGENVLARKSLGALLTANPADTESRILLESLERTSGREPEATVKSDPDAAKSLSEQGESQVEFQPGDEDEDLVEIELIEELDGFEEGVSDSCRYEEVKGPSDFPGSDETPLSIGIRTATLAELFVAQGHLHQALEVYRDLVTCEPGNSAYRIRLAELESSKLTELDNSIGQTSEVTVEEPSIDPWQLGEMSIEPEVPLPNSEGASSSFFSADIVSQGEGVKLFDGLESLLENIRRVRECRSGIR